MGLTGFNKRRREAALAAEKAGKTDKVIEKTGTVQESSAVVGESKAEDSAEKAERKPGRPKKELRDE